MNLLYSAIKGFKYIFTKECRLERKVLLLQGLIIIISIAIYLTYITKYEFRYVTLFGTSIPLIVFYLGFFGGCFEDVKIDRKFDKKSYEKIWNEVVRTGNYSNFIDIEEEIEKIKKTIISEIKFEINYYKKVKKNRKKLKKEFKNTDIENSWELKK